MTRVDWPTILGDIAYLLGDVDPMNRSVRIACSERVLAERLETARSTLKGWLDGSEPKHSDGERIIAEWCVLTGHGPSFVPRERRVLSAAQVR